MSDLITLGEALAVLASTRPQPLQHAAHLDLRVAGAEMTVAIGNRRLGGTSTWMGRVATDALGERIVACLRSEGVDIESVVRDETHQTGLLLREQRTADTSRVIYYRSHSPGRYLTSADVDCEAVARARMLHVSGVTVALSDTASEAVFAAVEVAREAQVPVSLDCNYRANLWTEAEAGVALRALARQCTIVFASESELTLLTSPAGIPDMLDSAAAECGAPHMVATLGGRGAMSRADGVHYSARPRTITQVDPIGAGDSFVAGYLNAHLRGLDPDACLDVANACGAISASSYGDYEGAPTWQELASVFEGPDVLR